ncbi:MAG: NUDIX domain-containing protein [Bacteroidia bacterium]
MKKDTHCSYCGTVFEAENYPKNCSHCGQITYINPLPVAVTLLTVGKGLLVLKRNIEPQKGHWALPGGFMEIGETWQQAVVRELQEETNIEISAEKVQFFDLLSNPQGTVMLVFGLIQTPEHFALPDFKGNEEVSELAVITEFQELAFPLHTEAVRNFFKISS